MVADGCESILGPVKLYGSSVKIIIVRYNMYCINNLTI